MSTRHLVSTLVLSGLAIGLSGAAPAVSPSTTVSKIQPPRRQAFVALLTSGYSPKAKPAKSGHPHDLRAFGRTALTTIVPGS